MRKVKKKKTVNEIKLTLCPHELPLEGSCKLNIPTYSQLVGVAYSDGKLELIAMSGDYPPVAMELVVLKTGSEVVLQRGGKQLVHVGTCSTPEGARHVFQWVQVAQ